jgi:hypothetical protein
MPLHAAALKYNIIMSEVLRLGIFGENGVTPRFLYLNPTTYPDL